MGIFTGVPLSVVPHATTGRADYFGALVNRAARLMAGAKAGQVGSQDGRAVHVATMGSIACAKQGMYMLLGGLELIVAMADLNNALLVPLHHVLCRFCWTRRQVSRWCESGGNSS